MADVKINKPELMKLPRLYTAQEIVSKLHGIITVDRLIELAEAGYAPCWEIDGNYFFQTESVKHWLAKDVARIQKGVPFPAVIAVATHDDSDLQGPVPKELWHMQDLLRQIPHGWVLPCVYFLIQSTMVVYVGQSVNLGGRLSAHRQDKIFENVFYLPVPKSDLDVVERAFIRLLKPHYNGQSLKNKPPTEEEIQLLLKRFPESEHLIREHPQVEL